MQNNYSTNDVIAKISNFINRMRGNMPMHIIYYSIIYVLYGIYKRYSVMTYTADDRIEFSSDNDNLLQDLQNFLDAKVDSSFLWRFYDEIRDVDMHTFEVAYPAILENLFDKMSMNGLIMGEFFTPMEINNLLGHIVKENHCESVFDPFCGTASIIRTFEDSMSFRGQEFNPFVSLLARMNLDAHGLDPNCVHTCDSRRVWTDKHFDAIVTCPPFNLPSSQLNTLRSSKTLEGMLFERAFEENTANIVVVMEPISFCFSQKLFDLRKELVVKNLLDAIYILPENLLFNTSIPCVIIVCKTNREKNAPVKFYNAESFYLGESNKKRVFDFKKFVLASNSGESGIITLVDNKIFVDFDYNLNPALYISENIAKEGQSVTPLSSLLIPATSTALNSDDNVGAIAHGDLHYSFIQIVLNQNPPLSKGVSRDIRSRVYECKKGEWYLVFMRGNVSSPRYALYGTPGKFSCNSNLKVMRINTELVDPEYLVFLLLNSTSIKKSHMPLSNCMTFPVVVDNIAVQKDVVAKAKLEYAETRRAEQQADAQRLGVKQNISDLEHMISTTKMKIGRIITKLEKMTPASSEYNKTVKELKDRFEYMGRTIHYASDNLDDASFYLQNGDIVEFAKKYADAWRNYGGGYFTLTVCDYLGGNNKCKFDAALMTVMLDSILTNAEIHSFMRRQDYTPNNKMEISLSLVEYQEKPYILLSVANNGEAFKEGFTLKDYITKGRYSSTTGRSGLGGYHVYKIAKGHQGFLYLDSTKVWNVVVEILIPTENVNKSNLIEYEHECI